jgi:integrase
MASVANDSNGRRRVQFVHPDGRRPSIRLGKVGKRTAESFARRVEQLLECLRLNVPMDADLTNWASELDKDLAGKLAKCGLIAHRTQKDAATLSVFIRRYVDGRNDVKAVTKEIYKQKGDALVAFFGPDRALSDITEGDVEGFKQELIGNGLASSTIKNRLEFGSQVLRHAVKHRLIQSNPFADVRIKVLLPKRSHFITQEDTERLIDACHNEDWRIIIALSRYGGMRCPSEVLSLRWADINWDPAHGHMTVRSPKTEHHPGKDSRVVPLFGLLRPHLERAFDAAPVGAVHVVSEPLRRSSQGKSGFRNCNLRKPFLQVIERAGMKPWPKLFHNLRSSRETELMAKHPPHDVCTWIGNSLAIAQKHYLQVTQASIAKAVAERRPDAGPKAAQNPAQHLPAPASTERKGGAGWDEKTARSSDPCGLVQKPAKSRSGGHGIRTHNPLLGI